MQYLSPLIPKTKQKKNFNEFIKDMILRKNLEILVINPELRTPFNIALDACEKDAPSRLN